jgi:hypothetical protein
MIEEVMVVPLVNGGCGMRSMAESQRVNELSVAPGRIVHHWTGRSIPECARAQVCLAFSI